MTNSGSSTAVKPKRVRYLKLGEGGLWEQECVTKGTIRIGFDSAKQDMFALCRAGRWDAVAAVWIGVGKTKGTATRFTNELRLYFEDDGSTLWITFIGERLCWGFVDESASQPHPDGRGVLRAIRGGWRSTDRNGEELTKDRLSGALTKLASYRGTSCDVDVAEYTVRRINGQKVPAVERALAVSNKLKASVLDMMRLLTPADFETLVDLVFSTSGWRRLGTVGGTRKTLDLDLILKPPCETKHGLTRARNR
ncbi:MAG TPA: hypothetical protein VE422_27970 [Terriglobia bacterium]|nr:hypothetical protein [Terriglobia bacterium]